MAIYAEQYHAVELLLHHNADPNLCDDDQVQVKMLPALTTVAKQFYRSPLFAVAGMKPAGRSIYPQLPPTWPQWMDAFRLLLQYGADVHETTGGRSLSTFNVDLQDRPSHLLEYLRILSSRDAIEPEPMAGRATQTALFNTLRCNEDAIEGLKLLSACGIRTSRVLEDSSTALHIASRMCPNTEVINYLCDNGCADHVNRRDSYGWTPLHYAVVASTSAEGPTPFSKVFDLIRRGGDLSLRLNRTAILPYTEPSASFTAFELLAASRPKRAELLMKMFRDWSKIYCSDLSTLGAIAC